MAEEDIKKIFLDDTEIRTDPNIPLVQAGDKVIFGEDDRKDIYELSQDDTGDLHRKLVNATVILTNTDKVTKNGDGTWTLKTEPFRQLDRPPCANEKFSNQKIGGWCSGFMVADDIIVTAGHCGNTEAAVKDTVYIFGFQAGSENDAGTTVFQNNQVYFGKDLIASDWSPTGDFAIVRVDRKITASGAEPLSLRETGFAPSGTRLGVIGYPSGLPVKIAFGTNTKLMKRDDPWLLANLDTYGGNSGSPVFNSKGEVEGILVRGTTDYEANGNCFVSRKLANSQGAEAVTQTATFKNKIPS